MEDTNDRSHTLEKLTSPQPDSTDSVYLAWKKAKIRAAIEAADKDPDDVVTHGDMWKEFGLDH